VKDFSKDIEQRSRMHDLLSWDKNEIRISTRFPLLFQATQFDEMCEWETRNVIESASDCWKSGMNLKGGGDEFRRLFSFF
jgi:hypothetical protein